MTRSNAEVQPERSTIRKIVLAALAGTSIEWYDFFIYGTAAALVFGKLFFPGFSEVAGTLAAFATFAVGFAARPLGGILFGHFGDKFGRKPTLVTALMLMATATFLIGLLPTYATIGIWAPIILVVLRIAQGLAVGGQWGGAVLLITEYSTRERRGFYGSFAQVGGPVGIILGNLIFLVLTATLAPQAFEAWGWRVPFLLSIILVGVGLYIQLRIEDTPAFRQLQERRKLQESGDSETESRASGSRSPIIEALRTHPKQILLAAGAFFVTNATYYIFVAGILDYGTRVLGLSRSAILAAVLIASGTQLFTMPGWAALSDRIGRRPVYLSGAALMALWAFPFFWLVNTGSLVLIYVALIIGFTIHSMMYGPQAALYAEMFSTKVRYSGASLGYQIASVFAGGLAPFIMTALLAATGGSWSVSVYMIVLAVITFVSVYLITETFQRDISEETSDVHEAVPGSQGSRAS
jgi:metabolite-proton symporter